MSKFDYPKLSRHDIMAVLADSQIAAVSDSDLLRPDPDFIYKLYTHILLHANILKDDPGEMDFEALQHLENPEHHAHSVQIINVFAQLKQILAVIKCPKSFLLKDLIKPEPDRTECFLSALLNFHLHRRAKLDLMKPIYDDLEHFEQQKLAAEAKSSQLDAEIAGLQELREQDLPLVQEISFKIKELHQNVDELNKHQLMLRTSIKELKEKCKEIDEETSSAEFALVQCVQENASLRSKIVQSPDKLQRALEEKKLALAEAKDAERTAIQSFQDKSAKLEAYSKACKKISKHLAQMQAVQEQVSSAKSVEKDVKVLKSKLSDEDVHLKSMEAKILELQSKADQLKDLERQMEKEQAMRQEEVDREVNNVKLEVESKRKALELRHRQVEAMVTEADAINLERKKVRDEADTKIQQLSRKSEEIVAEFDKYSKSISNLVACGGQEEAGGGNNLILWTPHN